MILGHVGRLITSNESGLIVFKNLCIPLSRGLDLGHWFSLVSDSRQSQMVANWGFLLGMWP